MGSTTMQLSELNRLARELREHDRVESAIVRGFGHGNYKTATSVALDVVGDYAPDDLKEVINRDDDVTVASMRANNDGNLETTVFMVR